MRGEFATLVWRTLALAWMATIFILSSQSSLPTQDLFSGQDKLAHFLAYGLLGVLLLNALPPIKIKAWQRVILVIAMTTLYGISDEFHQSFVPGREVSGVDVLADSLGGLMAALMHFCWDRKRFHISHFIPSPIEGEQIGSSLTAGRSLAPSLRGEDRREG